MVSPQRASRIWRSILSAQGAVLVLLGGVGLALTSLGKGPQPWNEVRVLVFPLNSVHSGFLAAVGLGSLIAARWHAATLLWAFAQCAGFVFLFVYGTAQSTADKASTWLWLDPSENFLHAALAVIGFVILCGTAAVPWFTRRSSERFIGHSQAGPT